MLFPPHKDLTMKLDQKEAHSSHAVGELERNSCAYQQKNSGYHQQLNGLLLSSKRTGL